MSIRYEGQLVKEKFIGLFEFQDYILQKVEHANKVWIEQDYLDALDKLIEFIELKRKRGELQCLAQTTEVGEK